MTQAGATVADEVVVAPALGSWVRLANYALTSAPVVVTNSAASTTYVEGTDYEVNRNVGFFRALIGGAIVAAQSLKVDYVAAAVAGTKIRGATNAQVRAKITFDGVNLADGSMCLVDVYEAVFSSSNAFDFLSDKFNSVPLAGRLKTPTGKTEPFVVRLPQG